MPDYSLDFSKVREMRKQNKRDVSRASLGNEEDFINPTATNAQAAHGNHHHHDHYHQSRHHHSPNVSRHHHSLIQGGAFSATSTAVLKPDVEGHIYRALGHLKMEVENDRMRELYNTLGIRNDDNMFDENSLSNEPSNGVNGTPSHANQEVMMQESQSSSDGQRSNIHEDEIAYNVEEGPKSGMHFPTMDNLVNFYKEHARLKGFSIVIRLSSKGNGSVPKYVLITCDKGNKPHGGKSTERVNCPTRINATLKDNGLWVVGRVVTNHIHQLDPSMSRFMAHHRCLSNGVKRSLEANDIAGIRPSKSIRLLEVQSSGPEKMGCLPKDCRNFTYNSRRLRLDEGDVESIQKLFSKLQVIERTFSYAIDVDWECRLRNILWVHSRGRAAYEEFHDVICFDTT
ncbi:hypothetical protein GH714_019967 [Hevea brasiliensis]|uniref:Uncharacterized protein n=1 Tax=Hevea brasiliensis TaxID=3981 RepID=A0A6A6K602_HEVBR|nr:hypothetical protein GH714_019967 [Hevea brasiliensis]